MPTPATSTAGGTRQSTKQNTQVVAAAVPFIRASMEHRESAGIDVQRAFTTSDQDLGVFDISAYGYLRSLMILVQATAGAGTSVTTAEDGPFSAIKNMALTEPNGAVIIQANSGYDLYLMCKWGGYRDAAGSDFMASPTFTAVGASTGNFTFMLRVPVEINLRDGLGSLPNQNAAATFKFRVTLAAAAQVYGTVPSTLPTVRVRIWLEAWDQPETDTAGQTNQVEPPAVNTTQFWSTQILNVNAGNQTLKLTRVGNFIRNLIFVFRAATRVLGSTNWPDPATLNLDTRPVDSVEKNNWLHQMYERTGFGAVFNATAAANDAPQGLNNGTFLYDFAHEFDGMLGRENRDLWLPTLGSTRLELTGTFGAAGTLTVLTNDVAVVGDVFI